LIPGRTARGGRSELRLRDCAVAAVVALVVAACVGLLVQPRLAGLSIDLSFWLRHHLMPLPAGMDPPVAIVAIDEETYRTPPFTDLPNALWTREIAGVLDALVAADVKVVGFDAIFPTSIDRLVPGFDRDFLVSLRNAARTDKVVLGEVQHQRFPIHPFAAQSFAVGNGRNIRSVNLFRDDDEVIRRVPLTFERQGAGGADAESSMPLELARRATGGAVTPLADGGIALAGYAIPGGAANAMPINFPDGEIAPTYSLADLAACARADRADFFAQHFKGKIVLLGAVLDVEDRKLTSSRFITAPEHAASGARCVLPAREDLFRNDLVRDTIPGVDVLATAIENLLVGNALREAPSSVAWAILVVAAMGAAVLTWGLPPWLGAACLLGIAVLWLIGGTAAFRAGLVLPLLSPVVAAVVTMALLLGYRFAVTDRARRFLRSTFGLYLDGALVDRLLASDRLPELGGEEREVTVLVSDVAGFTSLSERLAPAELVRLMNRYLTEMTEAIEAEGGFVDKYVGDAIVALFGAPLDEPRHALRAACAALRCRDRLAELNGDPEAFGGHRLAARIGLSTGTALVGNIGSRRRFNYTALGDTVNLAARLEGANKIYGTAILASMATRQAAGDAIVWREIDRVRVMGRDEPVTLYEPRASAPHAVPEAEGGSFAAALAEYRAGRFAAALRLFEALAPSDAPARVFVARARRLAASPPVEPWDAVERLDQK
jgi:class 3 adenylate cyclase/CHASE2 domain-containing sensor protein